MSGGKRQTKVSKPDAMEAFLKSKGYEVTSVFPSGRVMLVNVGADWSYGRREILQCASLEKAAKWLGWAQ